MDSDSTALWELPFAEGGLFASEAENTPWPTTESFPDANSAEGHGALTHLGLYAAVEWVPHEAMGHAALMDEALATAGGAPSGGSAPVVAVADVGMTGWSTEGGIEGGAGVGLEARGEGVLAEFSELLDSFSQFLDGDCLELTPALDHPAPSQQDVKSLVPNPAPGAQGRAMLAVEAAPAGAAGGADVVGTKQQVNHLVFQEEPRKPSHEAGMALFLNPGPPRSESQLISGGQPWGVGGPLADIVGNLSSSTSSSSQCMKSQSTPPGVAPSQSEGAISSDSNSKSAGHSSCGTCSRSSGSGSSQAKASRGGGRRGGSSLLAQKGAVAEEGPAASGSRGGVSGDRRGESSLLAKLKELCRDNGSSSSLTKAGGVSGSTTPPPPAAAPSLTGCHPPPAVPAAPAPAAPAPPPPPPACASPGNLATAVIVPSAVATRVPSFALGIPAPCAVGPTASLDASLVNCPLPQGTGAMAGGAGKSSGPHAPGFPTTAPSHHEPKKEKEKERKKEERKSGDEDGDVEPAGCEGEDAESGGEGEWGDLDPEERQRRQRLLRNRRSALQSRQRRKQYMQEVEQRCRVLEAQVGHMRQIVAMTALENGALRDEVARLQQTLFQQPQQNQYKHPEQVQPVGSSGFSLMPQAPMVPPCWPQAFVASGALALGPGGCGGDLSSKPVKEVCQVFCAHKDEGSQMGVGDDPACAVEDKAEVVGEQRKKAFPGTMVVLEAEPAALSSDSLPTESLLPLQRPLPPLGVPFLCLLLHLCLLSAAASQAVALVAAAAVTSSALPFLTSLYQSRPLLARCPGPCLACPSPLSDLLKEGVTRRQQLLLGLLLPGRPPPDLRRHPWEMPKALSVPVPSG